jgi:hypothetical protein
MELLGHVKEIFVANKLCVFFSGMCLCFVEHESEHRFGWKAPNLAAGAAGFREEPAPAERGHLRGPEVRRTVETIRREKKSDLKSRNQ